MESTVPSRTERQPLLRHVSPQPVEDDDQLSESEACHTQEHVANQDLSTGITLKVLATAFSFLLLGYLVARPGIILISSAGYIAGALLNEPIHRKFGQRGIAIIAPVFQLTFTILASTYFDPGQAKFVFFLFILAVGNFAFGLLHGSWSAWAGGLGERSNTVQGLLHGSFAVGAGLPPVVVTVGVMWPVMWYVLHGAVILQWILMCWAFRFEDGKRYREAVEKSRPGGLNAASGATPVVRPRGALGYVVTWICAAYFFFYVGAETGISGWVITFMLRARHATDDFATLSLSGFWLGMGAGRILLGLAMDKLGVRMATASYLAVAIVSQGIMIAVDQAVVSLIAVTLVGFFLGPVFPSGIVMITRLLPKELHVKSVSLVASVGQLGAAVGPIAMGALVQSLGLQGSQAIILAIMVVTLLVWGLFTRFPDTDRGLDHTAHTSLDAAG